MGIFDKLFRKKPDDSSIANGGSDSQNVKFKTESVIPAPSMERISKLESYYQVKFPGGYLEFLKTR
ncbi:MAG: hypothetical protein LBH61_02770, partial [Dysgonamonadaceae bacterium]|nr:hypothetical protein [Dysgonamonadaceae bacterium]